MVKCNQMTDEDGWGDQENDSGWGDNDGHRQEMSPQENLLITEIENVFFEAEGAMVQQTIFAMNMVFFIVRGIVVGRNQKEETRWGHQTLFGLCGLDAK
jgi:hypothetical protein